MEVDPMFFRRITRDGLNLPVAIGITFIMVVVLFFVGIYIGNNFFWKSQNQDLLEKSSGLQADIKNYQAKLLTQPNNVNVLYGMGWTYFQLGEIRKAQDLYVRILRIEPEHDGARYNLVLVYYQLKDYPQAIYYFKSLADKYPRHEEAHFALAKTYFDTKKFNLSKQQLQICIKLNPYSANTHYYLGLNELALGHKETAKFEFNEALRFDPQMLEAHQQLYKIGYF